MFCGYGDKSILAACHPFGRYFKDEGTRQEKALALLLRLGGHFRPQCGRFRELELALF